MKLTSSLKALLFSIGALALLAGCSGTGRSELVVSKMENKLSNFYRLQTAFTSIQLDVTTVEDLQKIGFGPESKNMESKDYLYVLSDFASILAKHSEHLPPRVLACFKAQEDCRAIVFDVKKIEKASKENFAERVVLSKSETSVTGWRFKGFILTQNGTVTYTAKSVTPKISEYEESEDWGKILEKLLFEGVKLGMP